MSAVESQMSFVEKQAGREDSYSSTVFPPWNGHRVPVLFWGQQSLCVLDSARYGQDREGGLSLGALRSESTLESRTDPGSVAS